MTISSLVRLFLFASRCWLAILFDATRDWAGRGLPFRHDRFDTPANLNRELVIGQVQDVGGEVQITKVSDTGVPSVSSNCENRILHIEQSGAALLPDSIFVKLPMPSLLTRWFFAMIGSWQLESYFCANIAPHVPLRTPRTFATRSAGTRFYIIQENLRADPAVTLFTNPDMLAGPDLALVRRCLDAFARLHACHYDLSRDEQLQILPLDNHPFIGPKRKLISRALNAYSLTPCMKKLPGRVPEAVAQAYGKTLDNWDALLGYWFSGQLSLLHGDSHLGNFFINGDEMGMLDFQAVHWGKGVRDVQYFLIDSLPADVLAANEQALLGYYVERRGEHGTAIDFETTWQEYRSLSFHTLMTIVVSIGLGALNEEQSVLMEEILNRSVAAVQRVDYPGWLDAFLAGQRAS